MSYQAHITPVILAGGRGARLSHIISGKQKVVTEIHGRPFLTYLLDMLNALAMNKVVLCTGHMADDVYHKLGAGYGSMELIYSKEKEPRGTGGAIRLALSSISTDNILVMNGDSFITVNLNDYLDWYFKKGCGASLCLTQVPEVSRYGKVTISSNNMISSFEEKGTNSGPGWINAGIYLMKKALLTSIPPNIPYSLEREFFPKLVNQDLFGFCCDGDFIDIGTPETYRAANEFFSGGPL